MLPIAPATDRSKAEHHHRRRCCRHHQYYHFYTCSLRIEQPIVFHLTHLAFDFQTYISIEWEIAHTDQAKAAQAAQ